jgi:hypothetical protein
LIDAESEELVFVLSNLVLNVLGLLFERIPPGDFGSQQPISNMPQSVFYCIAISVSQFEHLQWVIGELWVCVISVVNRSGVDLTTIDRTIHLESSLHIRVVDI